MWRKPVLFLWQRGPGFVAPQPDVWKVKEHYWFSIKPFTPFSQFSTISFPPSLPLCERPLSIPQWRPQSHKTIKKKWWKGLCQSQTEGSKGADYLWQWLKRSWWCQCQWETRRTVGSSESGIDFGKRLENLDSALTPLEWLTNRLPL